MFNNFSGALSFLDGKDCRNVPGHTATKVRAGADGNLGLIYHDTAVVIYLRNGDQIVQSNGHRTNTTKRRINQFSRAEVSNENGVWMIDSPAEGKREFNHELGNHIRNPISLETWALEKHEIEPTIDNQIGKEFL